MKTRRPHLEPHEIIEMILMWENEHHSLRSLSEWFGVDQKTVWNHVNRKLIGELMPCIMENCQ